MFAAIFFNLFQFNLFFKSNSISERVIMNYKISVIIEKDENGYYAFCPELAGCQSQGDTFEEAVANIKEAAEAYIETLSQEEIKEIVSKEIVSTNIEVIADDE
jgi:predicted RNase H-like HicB family nuclease